MVGRRLLRWREQVVMRIRRSFVEGHTTRETAGSFALGLFVTMLPTLGTGLFVFVVLAWAFDRINHAALLASVVVANPVVKWGVYAASFALGVILLGPVPDVNPTDVSLSAGRGVAARLVVGNTILAAVAAVAGYVVSFRIIEAYRAYEIDVVEAPSSISETDRVVVETSFGDD